jgi:FkbM family methyltransferase
MSNDQAAVRDFSAWLATLSDRVARLEAQEAVRGGQPPEAPLPPQAEPSRLEADIHAAYRLILRRPPDDNGVAYYAERIASGAMALEDLAQILLDSDEYISQRAERATTVAMNGLQVVVDPQEPEFGRAIARDGVWEAHIIRQVETCLEPGGVFVDIGANVGVMSFHAARAVGPKGRVIAFEPNPDNVQRFLQGMLANGFEQIALHPFALSNRAGVFSIRGGSNTHLSRSVIGGRLVQTFVGDAVLKHEPRIDLIKLDIEGHEPLALDGLRETLRRHRPLLLCEFNPRCLRANLGQSPIEFATRLFGLATSVEVVEHDGSLTPVTSSAALLALWDQRNAAHVALGDLPDGMVHFDLLIRPR